MSVNVILLLLAGKQFGLLLLYMTPDYHDSLFAEISVQLLSKIGFIFRLGFARLLLYFLISQVFCRKESANIKERYTSGLIVGCNI